MGYTATHAPRVTGGAVTVITAPATQANAHGFDTWVRIALSTESIKFLSEDKR